MNQTTDRWVLLVDDEPGALNTLADVLLEEGFLPRLAESIGTAKAIIETAPVGAVIVDVALGDGTGVHLAEWIWDRHPDVPVLFISAYTDIQLVDNIIKRGLPFFPKPLNLPKLLTALRASLREKRHERTNT